jgi:hypothetical protein
MTVAIAEPFGDTFEAQCKTEYENPVEFAKYWLRALNPQLTGEEIDAYVDGRLEYSEEFTPEYHRREACQHDGTELHNWQLFYDTLNPLIMGHSHHKPDEKRFVDHLIAGLPVKYRVGKMRLQSLDGVTVDVPAGRIPGTLALCSVPVQVLYPGEARTSVTAIDAAHPQMEA